MPAGGPDGKHCEADSYWGFCFGILLLLLWLL